MKSSEDSLVESLKCGDEDAYRYVYDHHYVMLCHIAYQYVKDHFMAETIVGDVIFHLWEIRTTLDITTSVRAYLMKAVRNRCLDYINEKTRRNEISFFELSSEETTVGGHLFSDDYPLGKLLENELENEISMAINRLPDECRRVFEKSRFEEKKYEEIAHELDISVNTVKYHIKNALAFLHAELGKYLILFLFYLFLLK